MSPKAALLFEFPNVWRGSDLAKVRTPSSPTGFGDLDRELPGGGWPGGALTEILHAQSGIGELRFLLPALVRLSKAKRRLLWIAPPHEIYAPALLQAGIDLSCMSVVAPASRRDMLWAFEQALRSAACGAVLAWPAAVKDARPLQYAESRKLQSALEGSDTLAFVFRPASESKQASAAALRLRLETTRDARLAVHILKRRGNALDAPVVIKHEGLKPAAPLQPVDLAPIAAEVGDAVAGHPFPASFPRINSAGELVS